MNRFLAVAAVAALAAGCASIISKSTYPVTVNSNPTGAAITIVDDQGNQVFSGTTPTTISLSAKKGFFSGRNYIIQATLPGYNPASVPITRSVDGWYFANILFGGVIGLLIVDPATGAMWKLEESVTVSMTEAGQASGELSLGLITLDALPAQYRDALIPIRTP